MSKKTKRAGLRKRAFRVRSSEVPHAVHIIMEFVYDMCLELGVCPNCQMRLLHRKGDRTFNKCEQCLDWFRNYNRENYKRRS